MKRRYHEVMDRIKVTDEMKARILSRLQEAQRDGRGAPARFSALKRYVSAAACAAILLSGAAVLPRLLDGEPAEPPGYLSTAHDVVEADGAEELSRLVGFRVWDVQRLPFRASEAVYTAYRGQLAEIVYRGEGQMAVFRKSAGEEDNSGDYGAYAECEQAAAGEITATLKGDGEGYALAIWSAGGYAYSLKLSNGLPEEDWREIISDIMA